MGVIRWHLPGLLVAIGMLIREGSCHQDWAVVGYPRLGFGPGQRYAAKGCYLVQLGPGAMPELRQASDWVVQ